MEYNRIETLQSDENGKKSQRELFLEYFNAACRVDAQNLGEFWCYCDLGVHKTSDYFYWASFS